MRLRADKDVCPVVRELHEVLIEFEREGQRRLRELKESIIHTEKTPAEILEESKKRK